MILNDDQLKQAAPAIFTGEPAPHMSNQYGFVNTSSVLDALVDHGWLPVQAKQDQPRQRDPQYVRHAVVLRHEDHLEQDAGVIPQVMLSNSHNGRTKLRLYAGLYRFVCANGLVVGDDRIRAEMGHNRSANDIIGEFVEKFTGDIGAINRKMDEWRGIELTSGRAADFAQEAARLRFGASASAYAPEELLAARRVEDDARDLWSVYNIVQENTVKGGMRGINSNGNNVRSRELTAINSEIDYNDQLWRLADSFAA